MRVLVEFTEEELNAVIEGLGAYREERFLVARSRLVQARSGRSAKEVERLVSDAAEALWEEIYAAGEVAAREHPTLQRHLRVHDRLRCWLKARERSRRGEKFDEAAREISKGR